MAKNKIDKEKFFARLTLAGFVSNCMRLVEYANNIDHVIYVNVPRGINTADGEMDYSQFKIYLEGDAKEFWKGKIFVNDYIYLQVEVTTSTGYGFTESDYRWSSWYKSPKFTVTNPDDIVIVKPLDLTLSKRAKKVEDEKIKAIIAADIGKRKGNDGLTAL